MQNVSYNTFCLKRRELMMEQPLPSSFEVIIIGTGLEESIVAAAAARNGHTVLHVDTNSHYGGDWAAFTFEGMQEWIGSHQKQQKDNLTSDTISWEGLLKDGEQTVKLGSMSHVENVTQKWHIPEDEQEGEEVPRKDEEVGKVEVKSKSDEGMSDEMETLAVSSKQSCQTQGVEDPEPKKAPPKWTRSKIIENSRRFNLDLTPKLLFSRGSMVELLISSNISRYTEFKGVTRVMTLINGMLEHVPSSRADVFSTKRVSVVEKRILMKFLTFCVDFEQFPEKVEPFVDRTYKEFLKHEKLTENLIHFVMNSIAMMRADCSCVEGLKMTQKFLNSLGRFGNTPFLWSMYGSGELPQAFCRLCAVFGGTYYLGKSVDALILSADKKTCKGIITDGKRIDCDQMVLPQSAWPLGDDTKTQKSKMSRKLTLLADSILPNEKEQLTFVSIPPGDQNASFTFAMEVGAGPAACPKEMYCFHSTSMNQKEDDPLELMPPGVQPLWSLSFQVNVPDKVAVDVVHNVHLCQGPRFELDYDISISNAKETFAKMFPGEDFLPRAPEPEEIIIGEETEEAGTKGEEMQEKSDPNSSEPDKIGTETDGKNDENMD